MTTQMGSLLSVICFCVAMLFGVGCASSSKVMKSSMKEPVRLSDYRELKVQVSSKRDYEQEHLAKLQELITHKQKAERAKRRAPASAQTQKEGLYLKVNVTKLSTVTKFSRIMFGAFAGRAEVIADVYVYEKGKNRPIGHFQVNGKSSGGSVAAGGTDEAIQKTAEAIVTYLTTLEMPKES